ncbi:MAG: pilus assembly protein PilM [Candidatus Weimeria sp.]
MAQVINLLAGDRISLVCRATKKGNGVAISDHFFFQTPIGTVSDGMISEPDAYAKALTQELANHGMKNVTEVNICLASGKTATREVVLPKLNDKQLASLIKSNADEYFPVDMSQYKLSYIVIGDAEDTAAADSGNPDAKNNKAGISQKSSGKQRVLIKAAPKEVLNSYVSLSQKALFHLRTIDSAENALYQSLKNVKIKGTVMYVDIGSVRMDCVFLKDGNYVMQRSFTYGGDEMIVPYIDRQGMTEENYFEAFLELTDPQKSSIEKDLAVDLLSRCVSSITRAADYLRTTKNMQVDGIVLLGTCAHLPYLRDAIQEQSGIDVAYIENIKETAPLVNGSADLARYLSCAACVIDSINLTPDAYLANKAKRGFTFGGGASDSLMVPIIVAVVFAAVGVVLGLFSVLGYLSKKQELAAIQSEMDQLKPAKEAYDAYIAYQKDSNSLDVIKNDSEGNNKHLRDFFEELEAKMPSDLVVMNAQCNASTVTMTCSCDTLDDVANVISDFRKFESIEITNVSVPSVTLSKSENGQKTENFTITATLAPDGSAANPVVTDSDGSTTDTSSDGSTTDTSSDTSSSAQ